MLNIRTMLIGAEGAKTPEGVRFRGDPAGASAEEARRNAHGKRSAWSGNQHTRLQSIIIEVNSFAMELTFLVFKENHNNLCENSLNLIENYNFYKIE
jgi:hypothetical protein